MYFWNPRISETIKAIEGCNLQPKSRGDKNAKKEKKEQRIKNKRESI